MFAAATAFALLVLLAIVGEMAARYRERHRTTPPGSMSLLFYQHNRLGHALVRDTDYFGWVRINRQGFRGTEVLQSKPDSVSRVMAIGASTTFDPMVGSDENAWPARLEYWLRQLTGEGNIHVINAGVPGYQVVDNVIRLHTELHAFQADIIILYHTHNDLFALLRRTFSRRENADGDGRRHRPNEIPTVTPWKRWLANHSLLYHKLGSRWKAITFRRTERDARMTTELSDAEWSAALELGAEDFTRHVQSFVVLAKTLGVTVVLPGVVHAWERGGAFAPRERVLEGYDRFERALREVAEQYGAVYIPSKEFGVSSSEWFAPGDPVHFNQRGADRMGRRLAEALLSAGRVVKTPGVGSAGEATANR